MINFLISLINKKFRFLRSWENEHKEIVFLMQSIVLSFRKDSDKKIHKKIEKLAILLESHFTHEELGLEYFYKHNKNIQDSIKEFNADFKSVQKSVQSFFEVNKDKPIDDRFITHFISLKENISKRLCFEEANLFIKLKDSK